MEEYISRHEHEEFRKRLDDRNERQDKRISLLEESIKQYTSLAGSVKELATNMSNMVREQEKQGKRLEALESRDGEMWRKVTGYIVTTIVGIIVGYIFTQLGMG